MNMSARRAIVGDIGGTRARFAIADIDAQRIDREACFDCADFVSPEALLGTYLHSLPEAPMAISLAVAGPVVNDAVEMTHLPWTVGKAAVARVSGAKQICLSNDFQATALALPLLKQEDVTIIRSGPMPTAGTKILLGAGTGLSIAALTWTGRDWAAITGEGGHIGFSARTEEELGIVRKLTREFGYVAYEHVLSGPGLVRLYRLLHDRSGGPLSAPDIVRLAISGEDAVALHALRLFVTWLGRLAGDIALLCGARGGVYIAGGIAPEISSLLDHASFHAAFESRGQLSSYVSDIPVYLLRTRRAGLLGAALALGAMLDAERKG